MPPKTDVPGKSFALEVVFKPLAHLRYFVRPDAISLSNPVIGYSYNSDIAQAASFKTVQEARNYWATIRQKFQESETSDFLLAKVVEVETVKETKLIEVTPGLNAIDEGLSYVLTRESNAVNGIYQYHTGKLSGTYTDDPAKAQKYSSVSSAVLGALVAQKDLARSIGSSNAQTDVSGIRAFRETASKSFKITEVEILKNDEGFQTFQVQSSVVRSLSYNPANRRFRIALKRATTHDDAVYEYTNVDPTDVFQFLGAGSKGAYYNHTFKPKYGFSATRKA